MPSGCSSPVGLGVPLSPGAVCRRRRTTLSAGDVRLRKTSLSAANLLFFTSIPDLIINMQVLN